MPRPVGSPSREAIWCWTILALSFTACLLVFLPLIPADAKPLGEDFSLGLPNVLAGYYWFLKNGPLATPWFLPAQCGGLPYFADPTTGYYTVTQWLAFAVGPMTAFRASFAIYIGLGGAGFYAMSRSRFGMTAAAATAAALLFLFSGFFTYRPLIGHFVFLPYALVPWVVWAVLAPARGAGGKWEAICSALWPPVLAGGLITCMFQASMVQVLPCAVLAVVAMLLVHGEVRGHRVRPWVLLAAAGLVAAALSASRATAMTAFLQSFPRTDYPLPGFPDPLNLIRVVMLALFWRVSGQDAMKSMEDLKFLLMDPEWAFGPGPAALFLLVAGGVRAMRRADTSGAPARAAHSLAARGAIAVVLLVPLVLNWHEPHWNSLLKQLPYFGASSNLVRWFALYVPIVALLSGLALQRVAPGPASGCVAAAFVAVVTIAWNAAADKTYYAGQKYDGSDIEAAWRDARASRKVPTIREITGTLVGPNSIAMPLGRNNTLTLGQSQIACYEPVFGYNLENFPLRELRLGPALAEVSPGVLNVKNPACYLYPRENACAPGDHFRVDQRIDAARFLAYEPFPFVRPLRQQIADCVNLAALCLVAAVLAWSLFHALRTALGSRITSHVSRT